MTIQKKERLWAELRARLQNQYNCASEYCAVQKLADEDMKGTSANYFRPKKPDAWNENPTEWHDSVTLANVMTQYEAAMPHFEFIGPTPIDFDSQQPGGWGTCIMDELCKLNLTSLKNNGKSAIGIIFNLDPHDKPGSHWVCAYIDLTKMEAYYYDSYGYEPCAQIRRLLRRCREQGCVKIVWNDLRHQRKKSECGTYCMYILISLLKGKPFADLCKTPIDDDRMNAFRDLLYATEQPGELAIREVVKLLLL
jgi:hypothetical protein